MSVEEDVLALQEQLEADQDEAEEAFQILEMLGAGSYGSVFKALHKKSGRTMAVKKVPIEEGLEDIVNEINFMKQCQSPYIVQYYGSYMNGDQELWIAMEYCGAGSVADLMRILQTELSEEHIAIVARDTLKGLAYLHSTRKIHRDIKAGNILLNDQGEGKLADFGVSGQIRDTMSKRNTVIGTPFWMAPEVIQEIGHDYKADIWSLGITMIELAEQRPPYSNIHPMRAIFMIPSRPPPTLTDPDKWSPEFNDIVQKCLTKNPAERPRAEDLLKHPFITQAKDNDMLVDLLERAAEVIAEFGSREKAMGLDEEEDNSSDGSQELEINRGYRSSGDEASDDDDEYSYGTMVRKDGSDSDYSEDEDYSTMKRNQTAGASLSRPPFLEQLLQNSPIKEKKDYSKYTETELKAMIEQLEKRMEAEIQSIRERYEAQKRPILDAFCAK